MKRAKEYAANNQMRAYKEHVDKLAIEIAASLVAVGINDSSIHDSIVSVSVSLARQIIDEVDRQVDAEIERTQYEIDEATANGFKGE